MFAFIAIILQLVSGTGAAQPVASTNLVAAACSSNAPAGIVKPVPPAFPKAAKPLTQPVNVLVTVHVSSSGSVASTKILKSSGRTEFDHAVLAAAAASKYKPAMQNCKPSAGTYIFHADFTPQ